MFQATEPPASGPTQARAEWRYSGKLDSGAPFRFQPRIETQREVIQGGKSWTMVDGLAVFPKDASRETAATYTQGVVIEALPRGESVTTNSPKLAETILGTRTAAAAEQVDFSSFFGRKSGGPDGMVIVAAIAAVALALLWRRRQDQEV